MQFFRLYFALPLALLIAACAPFQPYAELAPANFYIVQTGDTVYSIGFALELSIGQLQQLNPWLDPENIAPGMRLRIPHQQNSYAQQTTIDGSTSPISFIWPLKRIDISSRFGRRHGRMHKGVDLRAARDTEIFAVADGRVSFSGRKRGYGRVLMIKHGNGVKTVYAHNSRNTVARGELVKKGQIVARVGKSGNATGYHLHFEFRREGRAVDPLRNLPSRF